MGPYKGHWLGVGAAELPTSDKGSYTYIRVYVYIDTFPLHQVWALRPSLRTNLLGAPTALAQPEFQHRRHGAATGPFFNFLSLDPKTPRI